MGVDPAWRDPIELAQPAAADIRPSSKAARTAYSNSKLAILYYAHELQRQVPTGIRVAVSEPGFIPRAGLSGQFSRGMQRIGCGIQRLPAIASPAKSGPTLVSVVLDNRWAHLRGGSFVVETRSAT